MLMISKNIESPELDERLWRAWIEKSEKRDRMKLARRVKVMGILVALFALGILAQKASG
jgi:hypothetical protein